jgi:predicted DNA-binding transcriptional regulator YafY
MGIMTTLQSKKFVTAEQLSAKFEISIRTVYRDIKALGEIGVPVSFENPKGYFIVDGYFLPPVTFTSQEANALVLMETIAYKFGDGSIKRNYETALNKIRSVLKGSQKEQVDHLHSQIKIYNYEGKENNWQYLSEIQHAITGKTILTIEYENNEGRKSKREVEPIGLTFYSLQWHMIAWCWERNAYRDFKMPGIKKLVYTTSPFRKNKHIDMNAYIKSLQ